MKKHGCEHTGLERVVGPKPVLEYLTDGPERIDTVFLEEGTKGRFRRILDLCREKRIRFRFLAPAQMNAQFGTSHQGVGLRLRLARFQDLDLLLESAKKSPFPVILALDQIQDPGNVGTLARTLLAFGGGGIIIPKDRSAYLGHGAVKASAGTLGRTAVTQVVNLARGLETCTNEGFSVVGAGRSTAEKSVSLYGFSFSFPLILVLGNEDKGIRPGVEKRCQAMIEIPMPGKVESFNVAQAGAVILGEMFRQYSSA